MHFALFQIVFFVFVFVFFLMSNLAGPRFHSQTQSPCVGEVRIAVFSLQKGNLLVTKVRYLHSKFSFCMSIFLRDSQIFSVTCGCVQKLNIYKIYLENLRFSSLVIEFFYPCSRVAANFFSL